MLVDPRSSKGLPPKTEWRTPLEVFAWIKRLYKIDFDLDPCTSEDNPLGTRFFFTPRTDGLAHSWGGRKVFVNPPYGREIEYWVDKAINEVLENPQDQDLEIVMLVPNSTDADWFSDLATYAEIRFINGRISFVGSRGSPRNGSVLAYLTPWTPDVDSVTIVNLLEAS